MAKTLSDLANRMEELAASLPEVTSAFVKRVAGVALDNVVKGTPVDTGAARSNWIVSSGSEVDEVIDPYRPYPKQTDPTKFFETANAIAAINAGEREIAATPVGQPIFIQNSVDYIGDLNYGATPLQANSFVEAAMYAAETEAETSEFGLLRPSRG